MTSRLTEADRSRIGKARDIRGRVGPEAVRDLTGESDTAMAYAVAYGEARETIGDLLAIIGRLSEGEREDSGDGGQVR
jgi:hypothetical protein